MVSTIKFLIIGILKYKLNFFATIQINLKFFSFKDAIVFPICIYGRCKLHDLSGSIEIKHPLKFGLIRIGREFGIVNRYTNRQSLITISGDVIFNGRAFFHCSNIVVKKTGTLTLGDNVNFGSNIKLICEKSIYVGENSFTSWDVQIYDTNFHYFIHQNKIKRKHAPIYIGDSCWIGNKVTISKGAYICNSSIVASCSLINKNYKEFGDKVILAGIPAKFITNDVESIRNFSMELQVDEFIKSHNVDEVDIDDEIIKEIISKGSINI